MTIYSDEKWRIIYPADLKSADIEYLEEVLGLAFHWLHDPLEWVVAVNVVSSRGIDTSMLEVTRRKAGGFDFIFTSSMIEWEPSMLAQQRDLVVGALRRLPAGAELEVVESVDLPDAPSSTSVQRLQRHHPFVVPLRSDRRLRRIRRSRPSIRGFWLFLIVQIMLGFTLYAIAGGVNEFLSIQVDTPVPSGFDFSIDPSDAYTWLTATSVLVLTLAATAGTLRITRSMPPIVQERLRFAATAAYVAVTAGGGASVAVSVAGIVGASSAEDRALLLAYAGFMATTISILSLTLFTDSRLLEDSSSDSDNDPTRAVSTRLALNRGPMRSMRLCLLANVLFIAGTSAALVTVFALILDTWNGAPQLWLRLFVWWLIVYAASLWAIVLACISSFKRSTSRWRAPSLLLGLLGFFFVSVAAASSAWWFAAPPVLLLIIALLPGIGDYYLGRATIRSAVNRELESSSRLRRGIRRAATSD